jgi:hypothetical protein
MNAIIKKDLNKPTQDESMLPISQVSEEERQRRIAKIKASMARFSDEARQRGLTDEIAEEILCGEE